MLLSFPNPNQKIQPFARKMITFTVIFFTFFFFKQQSAITAQCRGKLSVLRCFDFTDTSTCTVMNMSLHLLPLLDPACLVMLSSSSAWTVPLNRGLDKTDWILTEKERTEQIMQPCNALMSCHAIRLRWIINLDHLSCHNISWSFLCGPRCGFTRSVCNLCVSRLQVRRDGGEEKEEERGVGWLWWRSEIRPADVDSTGSAGPLGSLILFIVSVARLEEQLRSLTPHLFLLSFLSLSIFLTLKENQHNV